MTDIKVHFVVYGVGAIGGFYGTQLADYLKNSSIKNYRLSFIARGQTLQNLKSNGIKLICKKDNFGKMEESITAVDRVNVFADYNSLDIREDELTVVLLCVKSKDTRDCARSIYAKLTENTVVISIQNGVENEEKIAEELAVKNTIACLTNVAAETLEPGVYIQKGTYGLVIGELEANKGLDYKGRARIEVLRDILLEANIRVKVSQTMMKDLWSKLVWNASFNPMSVLHKANIAGLLDLPERKDRIIGVMQEVKKLAHAEGYQLDDDVDKKHIERTSALDWRDFKTSMLQDYLQGKVIELDDLLGVIVRKSKKHGLETPFATALYEDLSAIVSRNDMQSC